MDKNSKMNTEKKYRCKSCNKELDSILDAVNHNCRVKVTKWNDPDCSRKLLRNHKWKIK
jgi:predicted RNA-binding Zn-ribbon protein involved in translation (DUF1610 family)